MANKPSLQLSAIFVTPELNQALASREHLFFDAWSLPLESTDKALNRINLIESADSAMTAATLARQHGFALLILCEDYSDPTMQELLTHPEWQSNGASEATIMAFNNSPGSVFNVLTGPGEKALEVCAKTNSSATDGVEVIPSILDVVQQYQTAMENWLVAEKISSYYDTSRLTTNLPIVARHTPTNVLPSLSILDRPPAQPEQIGDGEELDLISQLLEVKLKSFGIDAEVVEAYPRATITEFDIKLKKSVKGSRLSVLEEAIAYSLRKSNVRFFDISKSNLTVKLEIPNENPNVISLYTLLVSNQFSNEESGLTIALGHDVFGMPVAKPLTKLSHLLLAGTCQNSKLMCINTILLSLLLRVTPSQLRLILIDSKNLELSGYSGLPHLLTPVVTSTDEAKSCLCWCLIEIDRRKKLMSKIGSNNLDDYNMKVLNKMDEDPAATRSPWHADSDSATTPEKMEPLPSIVVVISEYSFLARSWNDAEDILVRLSSQALSVGMHLVLATQHPSLDVLSGSLKANLPTKIAFKVDSRINSLFILNEIGADNLLGNGDLLLKLPDTQKSLRLQSPSIDIDEVRRVVAECKKLNNLDYLEGLVSTENIDDILISDLLKNTGDDQSSAKLFEEAVACVTRNQDASAMRIHRELHIGFERAVRLLNEMEEAGIVSPPSHSGTRQVLTPWWQGPLH